MAPRAGFEPATNRLTAGCSTAELPGNGGLGVSASAPLKLGAVYNNPYRICQVRNSSFCTFLPKPGKRRGKNREMARAARPPARFSRPVFRICLLRGAAGGREAADVAEQLVPHGDVAPAGGRFVLGGLNLDDFLLAQLLHLRDHALLVEGDDQHLMPDRLGLEEGKLLGVAGDVIPGVGVEL